MAWRDMLSAVSWGLLDPVSPWLLEQLAILAEFGDDITTWPLSGENELATAARVASSK